MQKTTLKIGDVVQLNPDHPKFPGFLVVVTDPKEFGCQGYLMGHLPFEAVRYKGVAYVRPRFEEFEYVGKIQWMHEPSDETDEERP